MAGAASGDAEIALRCAEANALISPIGAEARIWRVDERDLLWRMDPRVWPAIAPILFPIVGRLNHDRLRVGAFEAPMRVHGFAAARHFKVEEINASAARFTLRDDARSRSVYPFAFALTVEHRLDARALTTQLRVENRSERAMPYACGLHPGFAWPFDGGDPSDYRIRFDQQEDPNVPEIAPGGLFAATRRAVPLHGEILALDPDLMRREALCFLHARSRGLSFEAPSGRAIRVETSGFAHLALWARPPAEFLCLETWTGHGDPVGFSEDLFAKPSMRILAPSETADHCATYRWT